MTSSNFFSFTTYTFSFTSFLFKETLCTLLIQQFITEKKKLLKNGYIKNIVTHQIQTQEVHSP